MAFESQPVGKVRTLEPLLLKLLLLLLLLQLLLLLLLKLLLTALPPKLAIVARAAGLWGRGRIVAIFPAHSPIILCFHQTPCCGVGGDEIVLGKPEP